MKNYSKGTTEQRPEAKYLDIGTFYWDTTLKIPIFWDNEKWVDSNGRSAYKSKGTTGQRPTLTSTDEGFEYYDSTLKKKILWNGTEWTNMDGTIL